MKNKKNIYAGLYLLLSVSNVFCNGTRAFSFTERQKKDLAVKLAKTIKDLSTNTPDLSLLAYEGNFLTPTRIQDQRAVQKSSKPTRVIMEPSFIELRDQ